MSPQKKRLGELLLEKGVITQEQLGYALRLQQKGNKFLGQVLISSGMGPEDEIYKAISELLRVTFVDLRNVKINENVLQLVPELLVITRDVLPLYIDDNYLYLVMDNPRDFDVIQIIEFNTHRQVKPLIAPLSQLQDMISQLYNIQVERKSSLLASGNLEVLGFSAADLKRYHSVLQEPLGMILVTDPSTLDTGRMSTMYATLRTLNKEGTRNIVTVEDPIKHPIKGIKQIQVNEETGLSFHSILSLLSDQDPTLHRDPNIIMLGEIRDTETAKVSLWLAEAKHLILSTVRAHDAVATITHLRNFGIPPETIASTLRMVIGQRLVRTLCPECKQVYTPAQAELQSLGLGDGQPPIVECYKKVGCPACQQRGYSGLILLYEILESNEQLRKAIIEQTPGYLLKKSVRKMGRPTMLENGIEKIRQGLTTIAEVTRACCPTCPGCAKSVSATEQTCPFCGYQLHKLCKKCGVALEMEWKVCPFCGTHKLATVGSELK